MKVIKLLCLFLLMQFITSCQKDDGLINVRVIQHCTGSYLKIDGENYLICNKELVDDYEDCSRAVAEVEYINWEDCDNTWAACYMEFPYEGVVQLRSIRPR